MDYIATMEEVIDERRLDWLGAMSQGKRTKNSQKSSSQHGL
jgi:hypothetical protein